jgi:enoyl-[acyl-carrier protein] reductase II
VHTSVTRLFGIRYPIVQAGMVWAAGWKLASAVSNAGGLGLIGSGSMYPEVLQEHIRRCRSAASGPFGVNIPLICPWVESHMQTILEEEVKIVFTSAGNPRTWTPLLKDHGITVVHVVPGSKYAVKAEEAGCDAVVAEGFEAGGHNGREETTTLCLVPAVRRAVGIPVLAAGGIGSGAAMMAAFALGAEGVQVGSLFVATPEASSHPLFKEAVVAAGEGDTLLTLKELVPVRLLKNGFFRQVQEAQRRCAAAGELKVLLGKGRARKGMFDGELEEGELEIGQVSALIQGLRPAAQVVGDLWEEFCSLQQKIAGWETGNA